MINGWTIFAHPLFLEEVELLIEQVDLIKTNDPIHYTRKNATRRLAAIARLAFDIIPQDPTRPGYRQGSTLGNNRKHWFRAKFFQRYRLFFRFDSAAKIIVYAWVNDEKSERAYGRKTDAYYVFEKMLDSGDPPDNWSQLLNEAKDGLYRLNDMSSKLLD